MLPHARNHWGGELLTAPFSPLSGGDYQDVIVTLSPYEYCNLTIVKISKRNWATSVIFCNPYFHFPLKRTHRVTFLEFLKLIPVLTIK